MRGVQNVVQAFAHSKKWLGVSVLGVTAACAAAVPSTAGVLGASGTSGKVSFGGKSYVFTGGSCVKRSTSARLEIVIGQQSLTKPHLLQVSITKAGAGTFRNPRAIVQWQLAVTKRYVLDPGVVKASAGLTRGTFSGTVTTGLGEAIGQARGSWSCTQVASRPG